MLDVRLQQLERGAQATQMAVAKSDGGLDRVSQQLQAHLAQAQLDAQAARREQGEALAAFRMELRSEEHTSELQSQSNLVCRLLLEKKKKKTKENETSDNESRNDAFTTQ